MEQLLRRELKSWQKKFKVQHGREPTKRDILADPGIAGTYDTWMAVGGDAKAAKSKSKPALSKSTDVASSSKERLDQAPTDPRPRPSEESQRDQVFKTPSKKRSQRFTDATVPTTSPSRNPFRTPTKPSSSTQNSERMSAVAVVASRKARNPFATPSKASATPRSQPSPAGSLIEVEMTPTRRSPLDTFNRRNHLTPSESPSPHSQYVTSSPSKLRGALISTEGGLRRTPTKNRAQSDAALKDALVAYTPRTKARKRLRGEDVPPTPNRRRVSGGMVTSTEPRAVQRGLFGFASHRKLAENSSITAPASVFARRSLGNAQDRVNSSTTGSEDEQDGDESIQSPIKAVRKFRRTASTAKVGFRPLFASPSANHSPKDVLGTMPPATGLSNSINAACEVEKEEDADALMDDDNGYRVGGLFAAEVQQRRIRRAHENSDEASVKKVKIRDAPVLPSSSDDEGVIMSPASYTCSPAYCIGNGMGHSSPNTEMTIPSSAARSRHAKQVEDASSPIRSTEGEKRRLGQNHFAGSTGSDWRKVQEVELSDEDEPKANQNALQGGKNVKKKVISMTPYQRYALVRARSFTSTCFPSSELGDEEEGEDDEFSLYVLVSRSILTQCKAGMYAVDKSNKSQDSDSEDNHASALAGLKLSPVRHAPSTQKNRQQQNRLLNNIFDPSSTKKSFKIFNPEPRFGPLHPSSLTSTFTNHDNHDHDDDDEAYSLDTFHADKCSLTATPSDDDDDWQNEVDQDFTFLDSEIELQDVA